MWYTGFSQYEQLSILPFFLSGIGLHNIQPPISRPAGLDRHQFIYCENGNGILKVDGKEFVFPAKSGVFLPEGMPHEYYPTDTVWDMRWLSFGGFGFENLKKCLNLPDAKIMPLSSITSLDIILNKMHNEVILNKEFGYFLASSHINEFIVEFCLQGNITQNKDLSSADDYKKYMLILDDYIKHNFMNDITMEDLSNLICVSPQHICRIFKASVNKRPYQYINMVRLEYAKELLITSNYPVTKISKWSGFYTPAYFGKLFKQYTGITPKDFRSSYYKME